MRRSHAFRTRRSGFTLMEQLFVSVISLMVLSIGLACWLIGLRSWYVGETNIQAEQGAEQAVRQISLILRQSMSVTVDANGEGLSYRMPAKDGTGSFTNPIVWDGINRRIQLNGSTIVISADNQPNQTICSNVITTDPLNHNVNYVLFSPAPGTITREVSAMVVTQAANPQGGAPILGRHYENIYLRNVPQLSQ